LVHVFLLLRYISFKPFLFLTGNCAQEVGATVSASFVRHNSLKEPVSARVQFDRAAGKRLPTGICAAVELTTVPQTKNPAEAGSL
jgi:hypothetical protein